MSCIAVSQPPKSTTGPWYVAVRPAGTPASVSVFGAFPKYADYTYIEPTSDKHAKFAKHEQKYMEIYRG